MSADRLRGAAHVLRDRAECMVAMQEPSDPEVALAVADLLENEANSIDSDLREPLGWPPYNAARESLLTAVADAILGGTR